MSEASPSPAPRTRIDNVRAIVPPPHHADAEAGILAALICGEVVPVDLAPLRPEHFFSAPNRYTYEAILSLAAEGVPVDLATVCVRLRDTNRLADAGGSTGLARMIDGAAALASPSAVVQMVVDAWARREAGRLAARWVAAASRPGSDTGAFIETIRKEAEALQEARSQAETPTTLLAGYEEDFQQMQAMAEGSLRPIPTGYPTVDLAMDGGWWPNKLVLVGARPGCGKTAVGVNAALRCAEIPEKQGGGAVLFISAELPAAEIRQRLVCHEARVTMTEYKAGRRTEDVIPWVSKIVQQPIYVDDQSHTIEAVRASVRRHQRMLAAQGKKLRLVVIDYYQELGTLTKHERRVDMLTEVAAGLKAMRSETPEATILVLAQLTRDNAKGNKRPALSDIAECDMLGRPADTFLALWCPDPDRDPDGVEMTFPKNRGLRQDLRPMFDRFSAYGLLSEREVQP